MFMRAAATLSDAIHRIDADRIVGVRDRIDRKIMEQIDPKDLFYQILDGLRSLTQYDHSSALLIREEGDSELVVVAEQIAWTKAKSQRIGLRLPIGRESVAMLLTEQIYGFDRDGERWHEWDGRPAGGLAALLDYNDESRRRRRTLREASMLCAPLVTRDGLIGILKIAGAFSHTVEAVRWRAGRTFPLARSGGHTEPASHRVAPGARSDGRTQARHGRAGPQRVARREQCSRIDASPRAADAGRCAGRRVHFRGPHEDLEQVQKSLQVCRRIFGGMLFVLARRRAGKPARLRAARIRDGLRDPEIWNGPPRYRAARRHPRRCACRGVRAERSRAGVPQRADECARSDPPGGRLPSRSNLT